MLLSLLALASAACVTAAPLRSDPSTMIAPPTGRVRLVRRQGFVLYQLSRETPGTSTANDVWRIEALVVAQVGDTLHLREVRVLGNSGLSESWDAHRPAFVVLSTHPGLEVRSVADGAVRAVGVLAVTAGFAVIALALVFFVRS